MSGKSFLPVFLFQFTRIIRYRFNSPPVMSVLSYPRDYDILFQVTYFLTLRLRVAQLQFQKVFEKENHYQRSESDRLRQITSTSTRFKKFLSATILLNFGRNFTKCKIPLSILKISKNQKYVSFGMGHTVWSTGLSLVKIRRFANTGLAYSA